MNSSVPLLADLFSTLPLLTISVGDAVLGLLAVAFLLFLSAAVSGSEVAFFSLTPTDYETAEQNNDANSKRILLLRDRPGRLLASILIANNFINIAIVLLTDYLLENIFPQELFTQWATQLQELIPLLNYYTSVGMANFLSFTIKVIGITFLLVLFGEVAPKVYASYNRLHLARIMSGPVLTFSRFVRPLAATLESGTELISRRLESKSQDAAAASREEIDSAIELTVTSSEDGEHYQQDVDILKRIVKFSDVTVRQIMRARVDVTAVDQKINFHELLEVVRQSGYSRIPVFDEDFDKVVGILYAKDLLGLLHQASDFDWSKLIRTEILFVPESKKISDLLRDFQTEKMHMAIVVDEFGGSEGVVTLEDIMEEVIGDIHDEFDDAQEIIYQKVDDLNYIFDGKTLLIDVCRMIDIPTDTFDAVKGESESFAGLILEMIGTFPAVEQEILYDDYRFKVIALNNRRIEEILITLPDQEN